MTIIHFRLRKITKRADGRFQAGYRDVDGTRKFITCKTEEEVLARFQTLQPTVEVKAETGVKSEQLNADAPISAPIMHGAATPDKGMLSYRHLLATMEKACEAAGMEHRGLHSLRHSFVINLLARGVSVKVISKLLGQSSKQITIERYVHLFEGDIDGTLRQAVGV